MSEVQTRLGQLIEGAGERDAIHIAVAPVVAGQRLGPGEDIGFTQANNTTMVGRTSKPIGIVDPFLKGAVREGERFWMFLYPNTITSLKHHWTHPAFGAEVVRTFPESEDWIRRFSEGYGVDYGEMIEAAKEYLKSGEYFNKGGTFEGERVPPEFWTHFERVTGIPVDDDNRENFFSCSC